MRSLPVLTDELLDTLEDIARQYDELSDEVVMTLIDSEDLEELRAAWNDAPSCDRSHISVLRVRRRLIDDADFDDRLIQRYAKRHVNPLTTTRCSHLLADGHYLYREDSEELGELEQTFDGWLREQCRIARELCLQRIAEEMEAEDAAMNGISVESSEPAPGPEPTPIPRRIPLNVNVKNPGYKRSKAKANKKIRIAKRKGNAQPQGKSKSKAAKARRPSTGRR